MTSERPAIVDCDSENFSRLPALEGHLAERSVRGLKRVAGRSFVVDRAVGRRELSGGMLLAVAATLAERWRGRFAEDRVGVVFPAGIGCLVTNLALVLLDKVPVNLNFTIGRAANEKCLAKAGLRSVITAQPVKEKVGDFPWPEDTIDLLKEREHLSKPRILLRLLQLRLLPAGALLKLWKVPAKGGEREAGLLFSSGSTGDPKGVVLTHRNIIANCLQIEKCELLGRGETLMACLPPFHSFGFTVTVWYPFYCGMKIVTLPSPLETRKVADAIEAEKVTVMMGTPTFFRPYFKKVRPEQLASLKFVVGGAEKTPAGFHEEWEGQFGSRYIEGYGLTETSPVVCANLPATAHFPERIRKGSVGQLFPGMSARVTDASTGEVLKTGQRGILELKGANVFGGYLGDPAATRACFREGWFVTGDLARVDDDGYLYIEGRLSRFSKIGGEMVPHGTIEQAIAEVFDLQQAESPLVAVTGVYDAKKGEALVLLAAVAIKEQQLRERLAAKGFPNLWIPRIIRRVDAIPCLASGKLDLRGLNTLAEQARDDRPGENDETAAD